MPKLKRMSSAEVLMDLLCGYEPKPLALLMKLAVAKSEGLKESTLRKRLNELVREGIVKKYPYHAGGYSYKLR